MVVIYRGRRCCTCDREWLPVYEKLMILRKRIKKNLDIYQLIGNASASAGYHCCGGNADLRQAGEEDLRIARNGGAAASRRDGRDGMIIHNHQVLVGCPHASAGSKRQVTEINKGGDGLVGSRRDRGPRDGVHWPLRTWKEGIKWMEAEIARLEGQAEDFKAEVQTYEVVAQTVGFRKMWSEQSPDTVREPGYIIKAVGRSTKGTIGVATENRVWYRQADLKKVPASFANRDRMDPDSYGPGKDGPHVTWFDQQLAAHGIPGPEGPRWGNADVERCKKFQQAQGWSGAAADGLPGPETLKRLAARP